MTDWPNHKRWERFKLYRHRIIRKVTVPYIDGGMGWDND